MSVPSTFKAWRTVPRDGTLVIAILMDGGIYAVSNDGSDDNWCAADGECAFDDSNEPFAWMPFPPECVSWYKALAIANETRWAAVRAGNKAMGKFP